jgi:hypothetical protein
MDACLLVGLFASSIDALAKHPVPFEFAGNDAQAIGSLGMRHSDEVFGQAIIICNEHFAASQALCSRWVSASRPDWTSGLMASICAIDCG